MALFKQPRSSVSHTQSEQFALWSLTLSSLRCTSFPFSDAKTICINGGLMHAQPRWVYVCVLRREVGIRGGRWMDKDNKRGKGSIHTNTHTHTHTRTHTHRKKAFEVSEHLSNLQSSLEHIVPKNTEKIHLTHINRSQQSQKGMKLYNMCKTRNK